MAKDWIRIELITGAVAEFGDKADNTLKGGVEWIIEHEPDSPMYQKLCNPLFDFFMAGGTVQSLIQSGNLDDASKNAVENSKAFKKDSVTVLSKLEQTSCHCRKQP